MKTYNELRMINVNDHVEKKGSLKYLSWTWAVDTLLQQDPLATWEFGEPKYFGDTVMVYCAVTALGKVMRMHLPVMDNRNNAVQSPCARKISDAQMRCLAKCIACFGIGLYIFAGEDLPVDQEEESVDIRKQIWAISQAETIDDLKIIYFAALKEVGTDQEARKQLDAAKDQRKAELS